MQIVIPMSGRGRRFADAGFDDIKPLILVDGRPMIEHVIDMFPGESDFLFICAADHLERTPLRKVLEEKATDGTIVAIEPHRRGPVHAVLAAREAIRRDVPVVLNYCDFFAGWDWRWFKQEMARLDCAGCITAYRGFHPHSLGPNLYAYMREKDGYLLEIREKQCFTDERMNEFASAGTYYFRSGALLERTFDQAIERDLRTGEEFYASTPYNLLVEQGLDVYIFELDFFLQWGTPEDLAEYQAWSDYFAGWSDWRPKLTAGDGVNLVPMAGAGERFRQRGYQDPKPLVPVAGKTMIERSLETLPPAERWLLVCRRDDAGDPRLRRAIERLGPAVEILELSEPTQGQLSTCLEARRLVPDDQPLLIAPCDAAVVWSEERFAALRADRDVDGVVFTFRNHTHANRNPGQYGWVDADAGGRVRGVSCKRPLADVPNDPGIIGIFWFRRAGDFFVAADRLVAEDRRVRGEFYVDSLVDVLVEQGHRVEIFDVEHYLGFGTPDDVETFNYWQAYFERYPRLHEEQLRVRS